MIECVSINRMRIGYGILSAGIKMDQGWDPAIFSNLCLEVSFKLGDPQNYSWLMVSNMAFIFHIIYGLSSFPLTNSYVPRSLKPPTSIGVNDFYWSNFGRFKG